MSEHESKTGLVDCADHLEVRARHRGTRTPRRRRGRERLPPTPSPTGHSFVRTLFDRMHARRSSGHTRWAEERFSLLQGAINRTRPT